jgi:hypothetical protein
LSPVLLERAKVKKKKKEEEEEAKQSKERIRNKICDSEYLNFVCETITVEFLAKKRME